MKNDNLVEYIKNNMYALLGCVVYGFLTCGLFLMPHFVHDTYIIYINGYEAIAGQLFSQGRIASFLFYKLLGLINMPKDSAMFISVSLSITFLSGAAFITTYLIRRYAPVKEWKTSRVILCVVASLMIFYNVFTLEMFMFMENGIVYMGVFLSVLAVYCFMKEGVKGKIIALLLLIISIFCYQTTVAYFLALGTLFSGLGCYAKPGGRIKKLLLIGLFYGICNGVNYLFIRSLNQVARAGGDVNIMSNIIRLFKETGEFFYDTFGMTPPYVNTALIIVFAVIFVVAAVMKKHGMLLLFGLLSMAVLFVGGLLPHVAMNPSYFYVAARSAMPLASVVGFIIMLISLSVDRVYKPLFAFTMIAAVAMSVNLMAIVSESRVNNRIDYYYAMYIVEKIRSYEAEKPVEIKNISFCYDESTMSYNPAVKEYRDLTIRQSNAEWTVVPVINYLGGLELKNTPMPTEIRQKHFEYRDLSQLNDEQFVFEGDTLYFCIY